jgi:membrane-anchored protein YejM (alkaline phosphatase superfamily)
VQSTGNSFTYNPFGVGGATNGDMLNMSVAIKVLQEFKPELLVVNLQNIDVCHSDFTEYCNNIRKADFALYKLWEAIQSTPGLANDTILIVAPEHGRNLEPNTVRDIYGRYALDHNNDELSRQLFCLIAGPAGAVKQNQVISTITGESIDIVPTIANILGFDSNINGGYLPGRVLNEAFV